MNKRLKEIGPIPITASIIESLYPELKSANKKVAWLEKRGYIIRLKRGLYVVNPEHSGKTLSSEAFLITEEWNTATITAHRSYLQSVYKDTKSVLWSQRTFSHGQ